MLSLETRLLTGRPVDIAYWFGGSSLSLLIVVINFLVAQCVINWTEHFATTES